MKNIATMRNLVIVESNAKAKTIEKYLSTAEELRSQGSFQVVASLGHVVDLPPKEIGIDLETWEMSYVPITGKSEIIQKLRKMVKEVDRVYLAADPDREGEAIAKNLYDLLKLQKVTTHRVTFHEITKRAVVQAIQHPREIDRNLVDAQEARRILDRVVGYKLSPLLWRRFTSSGLSAGRVQTAALRMVVERAREIEAFRPESVWEIQGDFELETGAEQTVLEGGPYPEVEALMKELARKGGSAAWSVSFQAKKTRSSPSAPFTTSSLQQEAYHRHHMGAKRVMQLAQALYEAGHITYMRTDSTHLSEEAKKATHTYIRDRFGKDAVVDRVFKTRVANAQEAHECIRPTKMDVLTPGMEEDHDRVYQLIWRRTIASQMPPAVYVELTMSITADPKAMPVLAGRAFQGTTRVLVEKGYLTVWQPEVEARPELGEELLRKAGQSGGTATATGFQAKGDVTRPPSLYQEPQLVKALEKEGIGRPSTYATIMDKIFQRGYVYRGSNPQTEHRVVHYWALLDLRKVAMEEDTVYVGGKETDRIVPTPLGRRVTEYLEEVTPDAVSIPFTARMEQDLDRISNRELNKTQMLAQFYDGFRQTLEKASAAAASAGKSAAAPSKGPKHVIKDLGEARVVETRYGPALFMPEENRFMSILPYLEWKQKKMGQLELSDVHFLRGLPLVLQAEGKEKIEVLLGRYGIYAKKGGANHRIPHEMWDRLQDGTVSYEELEEALRTNRPSEAEARTGQKAGAKAKTTWRKKKTEGVTPAARR